MILVLFGLLLGTTAQMQLKYSKCNAIDFKYSVCKLEKKLNNFKK